MDKLVTTRAERFWSPDAYARDECVRKLAERLPSGSRVLDAGAGASKYRPFFNHCRYETQDFCQYKGPLVQYLQPIDHVCDVAAIPLSDGCLDAVICTEVLEHVIDPMAVLGEFARLLKPGGKLLLTAPLLSYLHMEPYHYYGGFTRYWYEYWLPKKGFLIESITAIGGPGRSFVIFGQSFYQSWSAAEKNSHGIRRWCSKAFRALAKVPLHYGFPWLFPKFDEWLGNRQICTGYCVRAIREQKTP